jgi:hypothetical protein
VEQFSKRELKEFDVSLTILYAFRDKKLGRTDEFSEQLTWNQLKERSGLLKSTFSKYVIRLIEEEYIKVEGRVVNHKLVNFYSLVHPEFGATYVLNSIEKPTEAVQFVIYKKPPNDELHLNEPRVRFGTLRRLKKKGKGKVKETFVKTGPEFELSEFRGFLKQIDSQHSSLAK